MTNYDEIYVYLKKIMDIKGLPTRGHQPIVYGEKTGKPLTGSGVGISRRKPLREGRQPVYIATFGMYSLVYRPHKDDYVFSLFRDGKPSEIPIPEWTEEMNAYYNTLS